MRVAIASDIHGNKHAFQAVIRAAERDGADELWCLGDLVGYGAEPDACVALAEAREYLRSLSPTGSSEGVGLFHASPRDPVWEYVLSALAAELCFDATDYRISLIGHSHVALSFHRRDGEPATGTTRRDGVAVDLRAGEWLLNPGSAGQPRDGDARAAWLVLDTDALTAQWRRAEYDIAAAQAAIRAANLPDSLAERLQYGQ